MKSILVTGVAGFIGYHLSKLLLSKGYQVVGIDNLNEYYEVDLKQGRLAQLTSHPHFKFEQMHLEDQVEINRIFVLKEYYAVIHLAAQAGVRYSIQNPGAYINSNITGFMHILEGCRHNKVGQLIYASSSSVYGANTSMPFSEHDNVDHPVSLYAATKKSNELMAHSYSHLYKVPTTGLRFFTVYGPWGRPDMAYFSFARDILSGKPIKIFNHGKMKRDFTYIDDIIDGILRLIDHKPEPNLNWSSQSPDPASSYAPYRIYNIGNNKPVELLRLIKLLEENLGVEANKEFLSMQPGDVLETYADIDDLSKSVGFVPKTSIEEGIKKFVEWYKNYYNVIDK